MKRFTILATCLLALSGTAEAKRTTWEKFAAGPSLEMAEAKCNIMAMQADQGYFAAGSTGFVIGSAIGNAISNAIREAEVKRNCMTMQGWRKVKVGEAKPNPRARTTAVASSAPADEALAKKKPRTAPPMRMVIE